MLETMELLELLARVDHAAAWSLLLETMQQTALAPLVLGHDSVPPIRFSTIITDRVFLEHSWLMNWHAQGKLLPLLTTHSPEFVQAKTQLLRLLPDGLRRDVHTTRIPLWIKQDPEDMHRNTNRTGRLLHGVAVLAEWLHEYQQQIEWDHPLASFRWARLSLDCHDLVTLDRLLPSVFDRLSTGGMDIDILTPTTTLPTLLRETHQHKTTSEAFGGIRTVTLTADLPPPVFAASCEALAERHTAFDVRYYPSIHNDPMPDREDAWQSLARLLVSAPLLGTVHLHLHGSTASLAEAVEQVLDGSDSVGGSKTIHLLELHIGDSTHIDAACRFIRIASLLCHALSISPPYRASPATNHTLLRSARHPTVSLDHLEVTFCHLSSFEWLTDPRASYPKIVSLRHVTLQDAGQGFRDLLQILGDADHPLPQSLQSLRISWSTIAAHFAGLLTMLGRNRWLEQCVITDVYHPLAPELMAAYKQHEVVIVRQHAPLPLRSRLAFVSVLRRDVGLRCARDLVFPVVGQIFQYAAECKRRQCLVVDSRD